LSSQPLYIELSIAARRLLSSKRIDLRTELRKQGIDAQLQGLSLAGRPKVRDPFLIVLAAGVSVSLLGGAISRIISSVSGYKHAQMKELNLHAALDGGGEAIRDNDGNPVYELVEKPVKASPPEVSTTKLIAGKLLTFDMSVGNATSKPGKATAKNAVAKKPTKRTAKGKRS
jgi:hypothetical protein